MGNPFLCFLMVNPYKCRKKTLTFLHVFHVHIILTFSKRNLLPKSLCFLTNNPYVFLWKKISSLRNPYDSSHRHHPHHRCGIFCTCAISLLLKHQKAQIRLIWCCSCFPACLAFPLSLFSSHFADLRCPSYLRCSFCPLSCFSLILCLLCNCPAVICRCSASLRCSGSSLRCLACSALRYSSSSAEGSGQSGNHRGVIYIYISNIIKKKHHSLILIQQLSLTAAFKLLII